MNFGDLIRQGCDLEGANGHLDGVIEAIEMLRVRFEEMLDDTDVEVRSGSRFIKLLAIKALLSSASMNAFGASRNVKSALAYQQAAFPQPEDIA